MEKLALLGGKKTVEFGLSDMCFPKVNAKTRELFDELLEKEEISQSPLVNKFEDKFCKYVGADYGVCYPNGTTSIQAGLFAVGVGAGDEVIVPSFTFWATVGPVVVNNAIPVFADVDIDTHTMSVESIEKCITPRTKAILVVHIWGIPCDMDPIMELAKKYNLKVVEDCSHAHGASYKGKKVGTIGDVGCYSLQGSKVLPGGEAGILVTNNKEYYERALALGHYERLGGLDDSSDYKKYALTGLGYKHRVNPFAVAVAYANLDNLDEYNKIRTENALYFESLISDIECLSFPKVCEGGERIYGYHHINYDKEKLGGLGLYTLLKALSAEGVICGDCSYGVLHKAPLYTDKADSPMHAFTCPAYKAVYAPAEYLPNSEYLKTAVIYAAPRFEKTTKEMVEAYAKAYHKVVDNLDALLKYEEENGLREKAIESSGRSISYFKSK